MSSRLAAYVFVDALRNLIVGLFAAFAAHTFTSPVYSVLIISILPLPVWGVLYMTVGVVMLSALVAGRTRYIRYTMIASAVLLAIWGTLFAAGGFVGLLPSPLLPIVLYALVAKDLVIVSASTLPEFRFDDDADDEY